MICANHIFKKSWKPPNQLKGDNILFVMDFSVISKSHSVGFKYLINQNFIILYFIIIFIFPKFVRKI